MVGSDKDKRVKWIMQWNYSQCHGNHFTMTNMIIAKDNRNEKKFNEIGPQKNRNFKGHIFHGLTPINYIWNKSNISIYFIN